MMSTVSRSYCFDIDEIKMYNYSNPNSVRDRIIIYMKRLIQYMFLMRDR